MVVRRELRDECHFEVVRYFVYPRGHVGWGSLLVSPWLSCSLLAVFHGCMSRLGWLFLFWQCKHQRQPPCGHRLTCHGHSWGKWSDDWPLQSHPFEARTHHQWCWLKVSLSAHGSPVEMERIKVVDVVRSNTYDVPVPGSLERKPSGCRPPRGWLPCWFVRSSPVRRPRKTANENASSASTCLPSS